MKICNKCNIEKELIEFYKDMSKKDGFTNICKICKDIVSKQYYNNNKEKIKNYTKDYRENNKERIKNCAKVYYVNNKDYRENNKEIIKIYRKYKRNKENKKRQDKYYYENNKHKIMNRTKEYIKNKRQNDPFFRLQHNIRTLIRNSIRQKSFKKSSKTTILLGCTFDEFQFYLGEKYDETCHLDHICPCSQAQNEDELIKLQHFSNLKWLQADMNLMKSDDWTYEGELKCRELLGRIWI